MNQPAVDHYSSEFAGLNPGSPAWLSELQKSAFEAFRSEGFPTTRHEDWKYTDIRPITKRRFSTAAAKIGFDRKYVDSAGFTLPACHELVFANGRHAPDLSTLLALTGGVMVQSLLEALDGNEDLITGIFKRSESVKNAFISLNTALITDGGFLYIPDGVCLEQPVHLIFLAGGQEQPVAAHLRNLIIMGKNSRATVIESYIGVKDGEYFTNTVTDILTGEGAVLEHYKLQQESLQGYHVANMNIHQNRDSRVESHSISLGGALVRNDIKSLLAEEGAGIELNGLYVAGGRQHVDNHTRIDHLKPNTSSREHYRGVLDGHARGVFNGKVVVHKDAQKTDAHQSNANLLLSDNAEVDTKPELEIYADDVKCSHGATIGQLDESMLFYLRSRAIDEETARSLLTFAFADEVISHIRLEAVRKRLEAVVVGKLPDTDVIKEFLQ